MKLRDCVSFGALPHRADASDDRLSDTRCSLGKKVLTGKNGSDRFTARPLKLCGPFYPRAYIFNVNFNINALFVKPFSAP